MGLGLCYQGIRVLAERALAQQARPDAEHPPGFVPNFAVVLAPYPAPGGQMLALPACFGCLTGSKDACGGLEQDQRAGSGLLVARNGFGGRS